MFRKKANDKTVRLNLKLNPLVNELERYCPVCDGTGILLSDTPLGLNPGDAIKQVRKICNHCHDGVQKLCSICKEPLSKIHEVCSKYTVNAQVSKPELFAQLHKSAPKTIVPFEQLDDRLKAIYIFDTDEIIYMSELTRWIEMMIDADGSFTFEGLTVYSTFSETPYINSSQFLDLWSNYIELPELQYLSEGAMDALQDNLSTWQRHYNFEIEQLYIDFHTQIDFSNFTYPEFNSESAQNEQ